MVIDAWMRELRAGARAFLASCVAVAVLILGVLVAAGPTVASLVRVVGGGTPHVCHCEVKSGHDAHLGCGCPICVPDLNDQGAFGDGEWMAKCGDDELALRSIAMPAVRPAGYLLRAPGVRALPPLVPHDSPTQWSSPPDHRPPDYTAA